MIGLMDLSHSLIGFRVSNRLRAFNLNHLVFNAIQTFDDICGFRLTPPCSFRSFFCLFHCALHRMLFAFFSMDAGRLEFMIFPNVFETFCHILKWSKMIDIQIQVNVSEWLSDWLRFPIRTNWIQTLDQNSHWSVAHRGQSNEPFQSNSAWITTLEPSRIQNPTPDQNRINHCHCNYSNSIVKSISIQTRPATKQLKSNKQPTNEYGKVSIIRLHNLLIFFFVYIFPSQSVYDAVTCAKATATSNDPS